MFRICAIIVTLSFLLSCVSKPNVAIENPVRENPIREKPDNLTKVGFINYNRDDVYLRLKQGNIEYAIGMINCDEYGLPKHVSSLIPSGKAAEFIITSGYYTIILKNDENGLHNADSNYYEEFYFPPFSNKGFTIELFPNRKRNTTAAILFEDGRENNQVSLNPSFIIEFSEKMIRPIVERNIDFEDEDKRPVELNLQWKNNQTLIIRPKEYLRPSTKYSIRVQLGARDIYGERLKEAPEDFDFTTGNISDTVALLDLSSLSFDTSNPGNIRLSWELPNGANGSELHISKEGENEEKIDFEAKSYHTFSDNPESINFKILPYGIIKGQKVYNRIDWEWPYTSISRVHFERSKLFFSQNNLESAIHELTEAIKLNPQFVEAYIYYGDVYYAKKDYTRAIDNYNQAKRINPQLLIPEHVNAYYERGNIFLANRDYNQAIRDYNEAIKLNPNHAGMYINRGNAFLNNKEYDKAIRDYNEVIRLNLHNAEVYHNRGNAYFANKNYTQAINDYNQAKKINPQPVIPDHANAYYERGNMFLTNKDYERAIEDYNEAIKLNPNHTEAYQNRGNVYYVRNDYTQAIDNYNQAKKISPQLIIHDHANAYFNRGNEYYAKNDYDHAIADYKQAKNIDSALNIPNFADAYNYRGVVHYGKKDYENAIADFEDALKINLQHPNARENLANSCRMSLYDQLASGRTTITVKHNTELLAVSLSKGTSITLRGDKAERTITNYNKDNKSIRVERGVTLILESITLKGVSISVSSGGTLIIKSGTTIMGYEGNAVSVAGNFTMNGGLITGNSGNGVYVHSGGSVIMNGGIIARNNSSGVYVSDKAAFTMRDGRIENNTSGNGGGVYVSSGSFNMSGGTISDNRASSNGGGVYVNGSINMSGGTISDNRANSDGGGIYINGSLYMSKGTISNNRAGSNGGGVYVSYKSDYKKTGGYIYGSNASSRISNYASGKGDTVYKDTLIPTWNNRTQ